MMKLAMSLLILMFAFPTKVQADTREDTMYKGIMAHWKGAFLLRQLRRKKTNPPKYAKQLVHEAVVVTSIPANSWLEPEKLLGLATTESGLMWWTVTGWKDNLDCGITQVAVKWQERTYKKRRALCGKLVKSTMLSFMYAMKILNGIKKNYCGPRYKQTDHRFYQCLFNIYNQGHRFLWNKWKYCRLKKKPNETKKHYYRRYWDCRFRNRYWLKNICFARVYKLGKTPKKTCRKITSLAWLKKYFRR